MADRCKHELLIEQCADCRPLPELPPKWSAPLNALDPFDAPPRARSGASEAFPAAFESECAECGFSISEGDQIRMQDGEAVHDGCHEEISR